MEVVSSARVPVLPSLGDASRVNALPPPGAIKTELPAQATVQQAAAPHRLAEGLRGPAPDSATEMSRNVTIDAETQELVFQTIHDGEVVRQVPDKALLRMRAYTRELREADADAESERHLSRIA
jgi:hypothetical protein